MAHWLLIATFGDADPCILGVGATVKNMVPLSAVLKGAALATITDVVQQTRTTGQPVDWTSPDGRRVAHTIPLATFAGVVHGMYAWTGRPDDQPAPRSPAGAWQFNTATGKIGGSDDLLDLYGVPDDPDQRRTERATAEAFSRLVTNADEAKALATLVKARPGTTHAATWTVRRDDGQLRAAHFSCRMVEEHLDGHRQVVLRGITQDIGAAADTTSAPPQIMLTQQVDAASVPPGHHRALVDLNTMRLLRWWDQPMPGIAWEYRGDELYWIHPDDIAVAEKLSRGLTTGPVEGHLRFRTTDSGWRNVAIKMNVVLLDQLTTAGVITLLDQA